MVAASNNYHHTRSAEISQNINLVILSTVSMARVRWSFVAGRRRDNDCGRRFLFLTVGTVVYYRYRHSLQCVYSPYRSDA